VPKDPSFDPWGERIMASPSARAFRWRGAEQRSSAISFIDVEGRVWNVVLDGIYGFVASPSNRLLPPESRGSSVDRRRRYLSWRRMSRPGDAVQCALRNWRQLRVGRGKQDEGGAGWVTKEA